MGNTYRARQHPGSLIQRLGVGVACTATVGLGLLGLLPLTAGAAGGSTGVTGSTSTGLVGNLLPSPGSSSAGSIASPSPSATPTATPSTFCGTPVVTGINAQDANGGWTGPPNGAPNTIVRVSGSNLQQAGCTSAITVDNVAMSAPQPTATNPTPPVDSSSDLYFTATEQSGSVTVTLTDPAKNANYSNSNYTWLVPPTISGFTPTTGGEESAIATTGSGFTLGGDLGGLAVAWYSGNAPTAAQPNAKLCSASSAGLQSSSPDTAMDVFAPSTYCVGEAVVTFSAPIDTNTPMQANNINSVSVTTPAFTVSGIVYSLQPQPPIAGDELTISGSGFGTGGYVIINGHPISATQYSDRYIRLTVPKNVTSGDLVIARGDATHIDAGRVKVLPVGTPLPTSYPPGTSAGALSLALNHGGISLLAGPATGPISGGDKSSTLPVYGSSSGTSRPTLALTPIVSSHAQAPPNFISLEVYAMLAIALLAGAFALGFLNAARVVAAGLRARRAAHRRRALDIVAGLDTQRKVRRRAGRAKGPVHDGLRIGHLLLRAGAIDRHQLREALSVQRADGRPLGEILVALGAVGERELWRALSTQWSITLDDISNHWLDHKLAARLGSTLAIRHRMLPLRATADAVIIAMADPFDRAARAQAERRFGMRVVPILSTPSAIRAGQIRAYGDDLLGTSIDALHATMPEASARVVVTKDQKVAAGLLGLALIVFALVFGGPFFIGCAAAVIVLYALVVGFRTWVIVRGAKYDGVVHVTAAEMAELSDLPVYTILCPLYKEAGVLPQLVKACSDLDYPSHLLDVKLLLEADDLETIAVVREAALPAYFDVVVVPAQGPRTKPKACNYGLQFARGEYVVIFDAEDIPEPDQLKKAIATFRRSGPDVGCVQARLNFYNPKQNLLTGWFTLEYSSWFDFFLPGLVSSGLPVPLGGSSNHFPTKLLLELKAWDPENVTEDADLGMRLHRAGYRTVIVDSTTYEEANSDFVNWIKQRSRWGKGYAISWMVQMRHPRTLLRELGFKSFLSVQLTLGGTFGVALLNLFVWFLTLLWILAQFQFIQYLFPTWIYYLGMIELLLGNSFFVYIGLWSAQHRKAWYLNRVALAAPIYWLMMSIAMVKATLQIITKPTYWEKTVHGLFTSHSTSRLEPTVELVGVSATAHAGAPDSAGAARWEGD